MNDKLIINSISKVYSTIVSFFVFIFVTLSVTYLILSNGLYLKELSFPSFHINKLHLKWNKNLNISIDKLTIFANKDDSSVKFESKDIRKHLKSFGLFASFIQSIVIEKINYRDINATLRYTNSDGGYIRASSKNFNLDIIIHKAQNFINFEIIDFTDAIKEIDTTGNIVLDLINRELLLKLNSIIANKIDISFYTFINANKLTYAAISNKDITDYTHLIKILDVNPKLKYWVYDAIKMKKASLKKAYGFIDFSHSEKAFDNLYISIDIDKLNYTYHKDIDAIHTQSTNLEFKHGVLSIRPKEHTTYGFDLDKSWLKIDFNKINAELTLYLLFNGFVDKNLLHILNTFGIKLPFKQNKGSLKTDLTLVIDLISLDVDAKGNFFTKKANFTYLGLDLDIFNSYIELNNYDIKIDKMFAKYKKNISANVKATLDTKNNEGLISFDVTKANFNDDMLSYDAKKKLNINYKISSSGDKINISDSQWTLLSKEKVYVESIEIPFNYENLFATIPTTRIKIQDIATMYVSGSSSFKTLSTNLELDVAKFKYDFIELAQSNLLLDFSFINSKLNISTNENIKFTIANQDYSIEKPKVSLCNNEITLDSSSFKIGNILQSEIDFGYSLDDSNGLLNLKKINFKDEVIGELFKNNNSIRFNIKEKNNKTVAHCPNMDVLVTLSKNQWSVVLKSLKLLHKHSPLLQKYKIKEGKVSIFKKFNKKNINFLAKIKYDYKFISINNKLISNYVIDGYIDETTDDINFNINNKIHTTIGEEISIDGKDVGINLSAVTTYLNDINNTSSSSKSKNINLELLNSYVYFSEGRRAVSDKISLQYYNDIATAQLHHKGATAGFKLEDNNFFLYGENFNDIFMDNLFALSKFKGGTFDFSIKGSLEEFVGILYIKNTTVLEYRLLNNILAFVNTIPSLITFSLPGYNKDGLDIEKSYINFAYNKNTYTLKDIYLSSKEIEISGNGNASYKKNTIDLNLNLKTDLASAVSKIPVVGYIIFNEDSISTSLKVSGALNDPEVETMIAKDIIIAPLNIIKRTLLFPFKIFESD